MISVGYPISITALSKLVIKQMQGPTANSAAVPTPHTLRRHFLTKALCHL